MITRKQYMADSSILFHEYYNQFVNDKIKELVKDTFTVEKLKKCLVKDKHLNNIPLKKWDALAGVKNTKQSSIDQWNKSGGKGPLLNLVDKNLLREIGENWSLATATCILKNAARELVKEHE